MIRRIRKLLGLPLPERRAHPRSETPAPPPPLRSTARELARTEHRHRTVVQNADRVLEDYKRMDGALRVVIVRRSR